MRNSVPCLHPNNRMSRHSFLLFPLSRAKKIGVCCPRAVTLCVKEKFNNINNIGEKNMEKKKKIPLNISVVKRHVFHYVNRIVKVTKPFGILVSSTIHLCMQNSLWRVIFNRFLITRVDNFIFHLLNTFMANK